MTLREIASQTGLDISTVSKIKKKLGIKSGSMTKKDAKKVLKKAQEQGDYIKEAKKIKKKKPVSKTIKIRRIDKSQSSSLVDMLQDAKERYVKNEEIIQRLNFEIDDMDKLFRGNQNGTFQCMPQLTVLDKYQNMNIKLRAQIADFENKLGRIATSEEDDPFV